MSSREQFEAWFATYVKDWPEPSEAIQKIASDLYWSVWQASRAAVVVELPERMAPAGQAWDESSQRVSNAEVRGFNRAIRDAEVLLMGQGLKVQP